MKIYGETSVVFQKVIRNLNKIDIHLSGISGSANYPDMQKVRITGIFFLKNRLHWQVDVENKFLQIAVLIYIIFCVPMKY